jgi:arylsulfatase A-like enzyme
VLGRRSCTAEEWRDLERLYEGEVENLDRGFGRLLAALYVKELLASTVIVFVSDHGEGFNADLGRTHHGGRMHEDQIRIPLLIGGACVVPGVVEEPVSLVDVMPTILDLLGLEVPGNLDGDSLVALLEGRPHQRSRPLYAMEHFFWWERGGRFSAESVREDPVQLAVMAGGWWYIRGGLREELYEMKADPGQRRNLAEASEKIQRMRQLASSRSGYRVRRHSLELDTRLQQQLRALGYLR